MLNVTGLDKYDMYNNCGWLKAVFLNMYSKI